MFLDSACCIRTGIPVIILQYLTCMCIIQTFIIVRVQHTTVYKKWGCRTWYWYYDWLALYSKNQFFIHLIYFLWKTDSGSVYYELVLSLRKETLRQALFLRNVHLQRWKVNVWYTMWHTENLKTLRTLDFFYVTNSYLEEEKLPTFN